MIGFGAGTSAAYEPSGSGTQQKELDPGKNMTMMPPTLLFGR